MITLYLPEIRLGLDEPTELLRAKAAEALHTTPETIARLEIRRKSLDTRQRDVLWQVFGLEVEVDPELLTAHDIEFYGKLPKRALPAPLPPTPVLRPEHPIVVIGAGPAGLLCAQRLVDAGLPVIVIERGKPIRRRAQDTKVFRKGGPLNPESNIQFGEGGAGTYSDGKLTYRTDDPLAAYILEVLIRHGAKPEIRYLSRPHIGTEHLRACIVRMTADLAARGVEFRYDSRVEELMFESQGDTKQITGVRLVGGEEIRAREVVLAIGHSARETFESLYKQGVPMQAKAFSVGVRAEHPQSLVDQSQYGRHAGDSRLPAASYTLAKQVDVQGERGVYSFCMCPGGEVMACSSEEGGVVTNGMSYSVQRSGFANSGVVVGIDPKDFGGDKDPFAGVRFQRDLERRAFAAGGANYFAPAQRISDFLKGKTSGTVHAASTTYHPGVVETDLNAFLPPLVTSALKLALPAFQGKVRGYSSAEGIIVGVETRTSSPVRIPRGESLEAIGWRGLYPLGEGAGYAGGIVSAAVDGVRAADVIIHRFA